MHANIRVFIESATFFRDFFCCEPPPLPPNGISYQKRAANGLSRNPMETAVCSSDSGREERFPRELPCMFRWQRPPPVASCREGTKRPAEGNKSLNDILSKRQGSTCENRANGRGTGTERKCANLTRPRECRMKVDSQFPRHFAVSHGTPCGRNPPPMSAPQGEWLAKGQTRFARGRTPSREGKALRSSVFPFFLHPQGVPCGKKVSSLRKAVHFFAESDSVFTAKKRPPRRRNAPYKQFFRPFFNSPASVCDDPPCH